MNEESYNGFDHVFGHKHATKAVDAERQLHHKCVEPMLKRLFHGENCTILAYGQTGGLGQSMRSYAQLHRFPGQNLFSLVHWLLEMGRHTE